MSQDDPPEETTRYEVAGVETELLIRKLRGQRGNDVLNWQKGLRMPAIVGPLGVAVLRQSQSDRTCMETVQMRLFERPKSRAGSGRAGLCIAESNTRAAF